jgi:hypothetical protein
MDDDNETPTDDEESRRAGHFQMGGAVVSILGAILFVLALPVALIGFAILDRWHQKRAWREATRTATEIMKRERER